MSKERLIPNEVIVVGFVRDDKKDVALPTDVDKSSDDFKKALKAKFKFVRTTNLNAEAINVGYQTGEFVHIQVADPGGNTTTLHNGKTVKLSRSTNSYGWKVIFKSSNGITFDEIKDEIVAGRFEIVGTGSEGKIRLTDYALMGFWDEFPLGFTYNPHKRDENGKIVPLMAHPRGADGKYKSVKAESNTGRHFVLEGEAENLEGLRGDIRKNAEQYKVTVTTNDNPNTSSVQEVKTEEPAKPASKAEDDV
jgi:hypothetical protein